MEASNIFYRDSAVNVSSVVRSVEHLLLEMSNLVPPDNSSPVLCPLGSVHSSKIHAAVRQHRALRFVLPAFPAKSANRGKTLDDVPDYGEVLALQRLHKLCTDIQRGYPPGARIVVCSDGRVFNDLVGVTEANVGAYGTALKQIVLKYSLFSIDFFDLDSLMSGLSFNAMRLKLVEEYGETLDALRERVHQDRATNSLFNGIHRFLFEDSMALKLDKSRSKVRAESKELAYQVIQRSNAWSNLVEQRFPEAVRLSIHPQQPGANKIGIQMVPADNRWSTPWHNVVLRIRGTWKLVKRAEALAAGAKLCLWDGEYAYYSEV